MEKHVVLIGLILSIWVSNCEARATLQPSAPLVNQGCGCLYRAGTHSDTNGYGLVWGQYKEYARHFTSECQGGSWCACPATQKCNVKYCTRETQLCADGGKIVSPGNTNCSTLRYWGVVRDTPGLTGDPTSKITTLTIPCTGCPEGYKCPGFKCSFDRCHFPPFLISDRKITCLEGTYSIGSSMVCRPCLAGFRCPAASNKIPCLSGTYSEASASSCRPCPEGHSCPGGSDKKICGGGTYSDKKGASTCAACPAGTHSNIAGATSEAYTRARTHTHTHTHMHMHTCACTHTCAHAYTHSHTGTVQEGIV